MSMYFYEKYILYFQEQSLLEMFSYFKNNEKRVTKSNKFRCSLFRYMGIKYRKLLKNFF